MTDESSNTIEAAAANIKAWVKTMEGLKGLIVVPEPSLE